MLHRMPLARSAFIGNVVSVDLKRSVQPAAPKAPVKNKRIKNPERVRTGRERTLLLLNRQLAEPNLTARDCQYLLARKARLVRRMYRAWEQTQD